MADSTGRMKKTLGAQTYDSIKEKILNDTYVSGQKIPSIRETAEDLCVSRNTAERAYQQLVAEGYLSCHQRSGYFVEEFDKDAVIQSKKTTLANLTENLETLGHPYAKNPSVRYDFCFTNPAPEVFPFETWRKLTSAVLYSHETQDINQHCNPFGDYELRQAIARYLFDSRGVLCQPEQVILQTGLADGLDRLLKVFSPDKHTVAFEDPCLSIAQAVICNNHFNVKALDISSPRCFQNELDQSGAKLVYITPSHQFPTGTTMALSDRIKLLDWAVVHDAYIIEDDYDSEFRYKTKAIPSLHALDSNDCVIYTGSFSKTLSPNLRVSYWVLPERLVKAYRDRFTTFPCSVPWLNQRVLFHFMAEGFWGKHLRKYIKINRRKRELLLGACEEFFGDELSLTGKDAGLHVWAQFKDSRSSEELAALARKAEVLIYTPERFYYDKSRITQGSFLIGHSKIKEEDIWPGVKCLCDAWRR